MPLLKRKFLHKIAQTALSLHVRATVIGGTFHILSQAMNFKFTKTHLTLLDDDCNGGCSFTPLSNSNKLGESQDHVEKETPMEDHSQSLFSTHNGNCNGRNPPNFHLSDDILGLETPANQPFVLRGLKRILVMPARYFLPFRALLKGERNSRFRGHRKSSRRTTWRCG